VGWKFFRVRNQHAPAVRLGLHGLIDFSIRRVEADGLGEGRGVDERATTASKETKKERTELIKIDKETNRRILEKVYYI
jgi:hypothetical protein